MRQKTRSQRSQFNSFLPLACALPLLILCMISAENSFSDEFTGPVVGVLDGDTIEVLQSQHPERIRLSSVDRPEKGQAYGQRAKQAASELIYGKEVALKTYGRDKYGRTVADVFSPDGANVNRVLVKDGWCWWYRKYAPGEKSTCLAIESMSV